MKILFVCPTWKFEATGKYRWMTEKQYSKRVIVFLQYKTSLGKAIVERDQEREKEREKTGTNAHPRSTLYLIVEDAGATGEAFLDCPYVKQLFGIARHLDVHVSVIYYSLRSGKTLSPFVRSNMNTLILFRINNVATLETFYIEILSMSPQWTNFKEFKKFFISLTESVITGGAVKKSYHALGVDLSSSLIDADMRSMFRFSDPDIKKRSKSDTPSNVRSGDRSDTTADRRADPGKSAEGAPSRGKKVLFEEEGEEGGDCC